MKRKVRSGNQSGACSYGMILAGLTVFLIVCVPVSADTYTVCPTGCNFTNVQDAIDHASDGDTILVMAGEYHELLTINKTLSIRGEDPLSTTINGDHAGNVVSINAQGVTITNLTVRGSIRFADDDEKWPGYGIGVRFAPDVTITGCLVTDCQVGIYGDSSARTTVLKNAVYGNDAEGVLIEESVSPIVSDNDIHDNLMGILSEAAREGFSCTNNRVLHNQWSGLSFIDGFENGVIADNVIENNSYVDFSGVPDYNCAGGYFEFVNNCTITDNRFVHNGGIGFFISGMSGSVVEGNTMEGNNAGFSYNDGNLNPGNTIPLTNTVDGLPILYLEDVSDRDITGNYASIYCIRVRNITLHDVVMDTANGLGITFRGGKNINIRDNTVSNNIFQNILLAEVEGAVLSGNRLLYSGYGSGVTNSYNVTLSDIVTL